MAPENQREKLKQLFAKRVTTQARVVLDLYQKCKASEWQSTERTTDFADASEKLLRFAERFNMSRQEGVAKKICDALFDADCIEAYFVLQHGYPSGSASESWTKAQLQKYCDDRSIAYEESDTKAELITKIESV